MRSRCAVRTRRVRGLHVRIRRRRTARERRRRSRLERHRHLRRRGGDRIRIARDDDRGCVQILDRRAGRRNRAGAGGRVGRARLPRRLAHAQDLGRRGTVGFEAVEEIVRSLLDRRARRKLLVVDRIAERGVERVEIDRRRDVIRDARGRCGARTGGLTGGLTEPRFGPDPLRVGIGVLSLGSHPSGKSLTPLARTAHHRVGAPYSKPTSSGRGPLPAAGRAGFAGGVAGAAWALAAGAEATAAGRFEAIGAVP